MLIFFPISLLTNCAQDSSTKALKKQVIKSEKERVLNLSEKYWDELPVTVTSFSCDRSAGGIHDFYSEGDYWWPDPENADGPYIRKDGLSNPGNFSEHRHAMIRLNQIVGAMASAYILTGEDKYVDKAMEHLKAWFISEETMMNPSLLYAQAIKGLYTGRGIGIIDALHLIEVARSVKVMENSSRISGEDLSALKGWFSEFLTWISTHEYGKEEMVHPNNHGTCWALQASVYADLTGNTEIMDYCADRFKSSIIPLQMAEDGSLPLELARTKPYGYSIFNLDAMSTLAQVLTMAGYDLWNFKTPDGKSMELGMNFLFPYIEDKASWPYGEDVLYFDEYPVRQAFMVLGGLAYDKPEFIETWLTLESDPENDEVMRNMIVKNPLLWLDFN
ncbi:MAG: alginate lyase family protein [Bacteroidales bacterium]|nr:alginate lyase family protein [Bacteroidales bacterium]MCF8392116.1 alginate lyase family protein [Bacteroidales bacterium]